MYPSRMTNQPRRENEPTLVEKLRKTWPDWEITYDWYGCLVYPKGTNVFVLPFPEQIDKHLRRVTGSYDEHDATGNSATTSED